MIVVDAEQIALAKKFTDSTGVSPVRVVDPAVIARAIGGTASIRQTPARAKRRQNPIQATPARVSPPSEPMPPSPARAKVLASTKPPSPARATVRSATNEGTPARDDVLSTIRNLGRTLDDLERVRIMNGNRVRAAAAEGRDLPWMEGIDAGLKAVEHEAELQLKRAWRKHPLAAWAKAIPGAGEVLMARLIAEIGDPADRPNPGKLLAYCGHGDPARAGKIPKGATQEELFRRGNPAAKKAVWKLAYQFMRTVGTPEPTIPATDSTLPAPVRARSPYRDIYEQRKAATEGNVHERACPRCGPAGKPAAAGSPWSDAHRHHDALRIVGKRFLIDLWIASRHIRNEIQGAVAGGDS